MITPEVDALRTQFDFPGMKILQFAFALDNNPKYLPHNYERNYIVYPGTHDNNTVIGWFNEADRQEARSGTACATWGPTAATWPGISSGWRGARWPTRPWPVCRT